MKRRLTLALGCLACAMPAVAGVVAPRQARTASVATAETRRVNFLSATQLAQGELERRGLADAHGIASVVLLKGNEAGTGHYDVRIEPPVTTPNGSRLRGFFVAMDGGITPAMDFRSTPTHTLSTQADAGLAPEISQGFPSREG
jgi:hypothetical protein